MGLDGRLCDRETEKENKGVFHFEVTVDHIFQLRYKFSSNMHLFCFIFYLKCIAHNIKHTKPLVLPDLIYLNFSLSLYAMLKVNALKNRLRNKEYILSKLLTKIAVQVQEFLERLKK